MRKQVTSHFPDVMHNHTKDRHNCDMPRIVFIGHEWSCGMGCTLVHAKPKF